MMENELNTSPRDDLENQPSWEENLTSLAKKIREAESDKQDELFENQLKWLSEQPSIEEIQGILDQERQHDLKSVEQKADLRKLKEVKLACKELVEKIESGGTRSNIKKMRQWWNSTLALGVYCPEFKGLAADIETQEQILKSRRALHWNPKPYEITFAELHAAYKNWENGDIPEDDYLFGLIEHHRDFLGELVREYPRATRIGSNVTEEILMDWVSRIREMKLVTDASRQIERLILVRSGMRDLISVVQKADSVAKNSNLMMKILEEISSWNRKNLTKEELVLFKEAISKIIHNSDALDTKDNDWIQFKSKILAYDWKQENRTKHEEGLTQEQILDILRSAPRDIKNSKCQEWNLLQKECTCIHWYTEKQILEKIDEYLDYEPKDLPRKEIDSFLISTEVVALGDDAQNKVRVFRMALNNCPFDKIESVNSIEELVKEMIDAKLWNNLLFTRFDMINRTIQDIIRDAEVIENKKVHGIENNELDDQKERSGKKDLKLQLGPCQTLLQDYNRIPEHLKPVCTREHKVLEQEVDSFIEFINQVEQSSKSLISKLLDVVKGEELQSIQTNLTKWTSDYNSSPIKNEGIEQTLEVLDVLIRACQLLEPTSNHSKDLQYWDHMMAEIRRVCKIDKKLALPAILQSLEEPVKDAKAFLKSCHELKYKMDKDTKPKTIEEVKKMIEDRKVISSSVNFSEQISFLQEIIAKAEELAQTLKQEKVDISQLKEALASVQKLNVDFGDTVQLCRNRIENAEAYILKFKGLKEDKLEKDFESITEEYNQLGVMIPDIESTFNQVQECKNIRAEADRAVNNDAYSLEELIDLKHRVTKMKYRKSANVVGKILSKLFYKMREIYESADESNKNLVDIADLNKYDAEAQFVLKKTIRSEIKQDLKEKHGYLNQIIKDVNDHLNKTVVPLTLVQLDEKPPEEVFRYFIKIDSAIKGIINKKETQKKIEEANIQHELEKSKTEINIIMKETIDQKLRNEKTRAIKELLLGNTHLPLDQRDLSQYAKNIERELFSLTESNPTDYLPKFEEVYKLLKELNFLPLLSSHLHEKKFAYKSLKEYIGKCSADLKAANQVFSKASQQIQHANPLNQNTSLSLKAAEEASSKPLLDRTAATTDSEKQKKLIKERSEVSEDLKLFTGDYKYYRIFSGKLILQSSEAEKFENFELLSCTKSSSIYKLAHIPQGLSFHTTIGRIKFITYINKIIQDLGSKYRLISAYCGQFEGIDKMRKLLIEKDSVASSQYTTTSKLFVFPREFLQKNWVDELEIITVAKEVELFSFIIQKIEEKDPGKQDNPLMPEPLKPNSQRAFKLIYKGSVKDIPINIEQLREVKVLLKVPNKYQPDLRTTLDQFPAKRSYQDSQTNKEESVKEAIKNYSKKLNNLSLSNKQYDPEEAINRTETRIERDRVGQFGQTRKPAGFSKADWAVKESLADRLESREYETDLIGALQSNTQLKQIGRNIGKTNPFEKPSTEFSQGINHTYSGMANPSMPKLLAKRPPELSQAFIPPNQYSGRLGDAYDSDSPVIQNSNSTFLQNAINTIQAPFKGNDSFTTSNDKPTKKISNSQLKSEVLYRKKYAPGIRTGNNYPESSKPYPENSRNRFY